MKKLLNKTLLPLIIYALVVLTLSVPVYFYIINKIWVNELDDNHRGVKNRVETEFNTLNYDESKLSETINLWNRLQHGAQIKSVKASDIEADQFYTTSRFDSYHNEEEQFRGLSTFIHINQKPYLLTIETNMEEMNETVLIIALVALGFFLLLLGGFIILNRQLSGKIWKPFYSTISKLKTFDLNSNQNITLEASSTIEFEELNRSVENLIQNNISTFRQQKEFTENASHELQTPLAIIKSKLDLLLQDPALTKEQAEMIESINIPISRASRINKNLLLLAKIENQQFDENSSVNISELLKENILFLSDHIENKKMLIEKNIQENMVVECNKSLLEMLITNLLLNAIRHAKEGGRVRIELTDKILRFANTGESSLAKESLFKRFIASSTQTPNSGLGLAIVKQICNRNKWHINYDFEEGYHVFTVTF